MDIETVRSFLAWCTTIDLVILLAWWGMFSLAGDWLYGVHGKLFDMPRQTFDSIHYSGMAAFKIMIFVFNLAPYLTLRLFF